jgi:hypothetical protein
MLLTGEQRRVFCAGHIDGLLHGEWSLRALPKGAPCSKYKDRQEAEASAEMEFHCTTFNVAKNYDDFS